MFFFFSLFVVVFLLFEVEFKLAKKKLFGTDIIASAHFCDI